MEIEFYKRIDLSEFVEYIELKTFSGDIAIQTCICYNASRQREISGPYVHKAKTPERHLRGFL